MTDERMDARLRAAGEQWRAANDAPAGVDVAATISGHEPEIIAPAPRRPRHWSLLASAAVIAAALVVGGALVLRGGSGQPSRPESDNAGLVGTVWELVGYNDNPDRRTSSDATFYIGKDGQLVADDSCAVIGAKAQVGDGQLTVTDQVVRYRSCTDTVGDMVFTSGGTDVLDGTVSYLIDDDTMTISRAGTTMHFVAAPPDLPAPTLDVPTFVGAHWNLVKAVDANGNEVPLTGDIPFFVADDGSLTASDGCNKLTGTVHGIGRVTFDNVGGTEIGCPSQLVILAVLNGTADEQVDGATLTITKDGVGVLTYQWVPDDKSATDPQSLDGKTWRLSSVAGQPAASDAQLKINGTTYTANDGCREFSGDVSVQPGSIAFTGVPRSNPPCGGEGGGQASTIDSFLSSPPTLWSIRDGQLIIDGGGGQAFSLVFTGGSGPPPSVTNPGDELIGRAWYLTQISQEDGNSATSQSVSAELLLRFASGGGVRLSERCAGGDGSVTLGAATADFSGLELADKFDCAFTANDVDLSAADAATVLHVLDGTTSWVIDGDQLSITKNGTTLIFSSTPPPTSLPGTQWKLTSFEIAPDPANGGNGLHAGSLRFNEDGTFVEHGGCAPYQGRVQISDASVQFSDVAPVGGGRCIDLSGGQERAFAAIFRDGTASLSLTDGELTLSRQGAVLHFVQE